MPLSFEDHAEYARYWHYYFRREVVSLLLNARHSNKEDKEHLPDRGFNRNRPSYFKGFLTLGGVAGLRDSGIKLQLYDRPPSVTDDQQDKEVTNDFKVKQLREHDVIFMTSQKLDLGPRDDFKSVANLQFLRQSLLKSDSMLAIVSKKAQMTKNGVGPATLEIDISKQMFVDK